MLPAGGGQRRETVAAWYARRVVRVADLWRKLFARPTTTLDQYLAPGENVVFVDAPSYKSFLVENVVPLLLIGSVSAVTIYFGLESTHYWTMARRLAVLFLLFSYMVVKRWLQHYTAYVMTTMRIMRLSGVFNRSLAWIPWVKITDIRYETTFVGRLLGYSTVYIDSANEQSGLGRMKNLQHPREFYRILTEQVEQKQGNIRSQAALID
jgi:membrane protein YdbS with pleckstrin-like domain